MDQHSHTPPHYDMGFRHQHPEVAAYTDAINKIDEPHNFRDAFTRTLTDVLQDADAATLANLLYQVVQAYATLGYGITYAFGPQLQFGMIVTRINPTTKTPDSRCYEDYAVWCEMGTITDLETAIQWMRSQTAATPRQS